MRIAPRLARPAALAAVAAAALAIGAPSAGATMQDCLNARMKTAQDMLAHGQESPDMYWTYWWVAVGSINNMTKCPDR